MTTSSSYETCEETRGGLLFRCSSLRPGLCVVVSVYMFKTRKQHRYINLQSETVGGTSVALSVKRF